jgi:hypothetical protein
MDPESELSERERRQDPEPVDWHGEIPFRGESMSARWKQRQLQLLHAGIDAADNDSEVMTLDDWRVLYAVDADGQLVWI